MNIITLATTDLNSIYAVNCKYRKFIDSEYRKVPSDIKKKFLIWFSFRVREKGLIDKRQINIWDFTNSWGSFSMLYEIFLDWNKIKRKYYFEYQFKDYLDYHDILNSKEYNFKFHNIFTKRVEKALESLDNVYKKAFKHW